MKKLHLHMIGYLALLILAGALLYHMCHTTKQAMPSFVIDTKFVGEYSLGGGEWRTLEQSTKLSGFGGDLVLRGQFDETYPMYVSFYLNHIGVTISVNGEEVFQSGRTDNDIPEMMCVKGWASWLYEEADPEDEVEIHLHNPHSYGNTGAYHQFLDSLCLGSGMALEDHVESLGMPYRIASFFIIVISIALAGVAISYFLQGISSARLLLGTGLLSLFMGGYIMLDAVDIEFHSNVIVFNTCLCQYCIMFAALALVYCIRQTLTEKRRKIAGILAVISEIQVGIFILFSLLGMIDIYDTGLFWAVVQGSVFLVLIGLCVQEFRLGEKDNRILSVSYIILMSAAVLELVNAGMNFWTGGIVVKIVFGLMLVFQLVRAVKVVAVNHLASRKAKELEEELRNSRIVLAMSQIKTHFIFNVLTAISGMCEYDPKKADETLVRFSRYLRSNIDVMDTDELEMFSKSLEHLEDYVALEQIRFGEKLQFVKNLEITEFKIPPLVLQPVVENSIKHGLLPKSSGGIIELHTWKNGENIMITVTDDGVGFDMENERCKESVGIRNVCFRLEQMIHGRMDMESSPGKGTKVTIIIPCKEVVR